MTWEEDLFCGGVFLRDDSGKSVGHVHPVDTRDSVVFQVFYEGKMVAERPTKNSALSALARLHEIATGPEVKNGE
jgi:hypothetical protein